MLTLSMLRRLAARAIRPVRQQLRWWRTLCGATALLALLPVAEARAGELRCEPRAVLLAELERDRGQRPAASLLFDGMLQEFLAAGDGRWTLLVTPPGELTCVFAEGEGFRLLLSSPALLGRAAFPRPLEGRF